MLIVEDDPLSAKLLFVVLAQTGASLQVVSSAEEALDMVASFKPRVILLDLMLPRMSGLALAEQLKPRTKKGEVTIIAVSSANGPEVARLTAEAGCAAYMRKPINGDGIVELILSHLVGRR